MTAGARWADIITGGPRPAWAIWDVHRNEWNGWSWSTACHEVIAELYNLWEQRAEAAINRVVVPFDSLTFTRVGPPLTEAEMWEIYSRRPLRPLCRT